MPQKPKNNTHQRRAQTADRMRKTLGKRQGPKSLCLTMIVKNESHNMPRLLDSLESIVDMIAITDTGSTDNTPEVITNWGKEHNIPTVVHHEPFTDFGYNRTYSVQAAKKSFPNADYFLLSDADFVWEIKDFDKCLLTDHKYLVEQYNKAMRYWNIRILSSKADFECFGVTHEYWDNATTQTDYGGEIRTAKINELKINDLEDGGCKDDKFVRDERLLRARLADPKTKPGLLTRYKFYLAQTLKDMKRYLEAIEYYHERIKDKGWVEELYYAKFQIGFCYENLGWNAKRAISIYSQAEKSEEELAFCKLQNPNNLSIKDFAALITKYFEESAVNYMAAYTFRKTRAEAIYYLTRLYRSQELHEMAFKTAMMGNKIKYPHEDSLFVEHGCYDYLFDWELSIVCYYIPSQKKVGREAIKRLMVRDDLPDYINSVMDRNRQGYL